MGNYNTIDEGAKASMSSSTNDEGTSSSTNKSVPTRYSDGNSTMTISSHDTTCHIIVMEVDKPRAQAITTSTSSSHIIDMEVDNPRAQANDSVLPMYSNLRLTHIGRLLAAEFEAYYLVIRDALLCRVHM